MEILILLTTLLALLSYSSCSDTNQILGAECSADIKANLTNDYQINFKNLMDSLATNAPSNNGFYKAESGKNSDKIYGLTQCRADLSSANCAACIKNATLNRGCYTDSKSVTKWYRWCFLRYSNQRFFGVWDRSAMAIANDTNLEDPNVVSKTLNFMNDLVSTAPDQPLMFQTKVLDVGKYEKRYALAQCTRDISRQDCGKCFDDQLVIFRSRIGNKKEWEAHGHGCSMWYGDSQFYFNYTFPKDLPTNKGENTGGGTVNSSPERFSIGMIVPVLMFLLVL
ncbi:cysteine-rich repeat secretory protein 38-like isoform X1 [Mercurialis annua]|uniref:cysteine-rich repeat secretory protein 38-like isoform X1 n=1 Tax=Mercurialis annua TaxID=3986 RepID=UPI00215E514E|nr:cysteine-rich repeat secretory protein 38-like isoform X1 [Mercurialis annua]